VAVMIKLETVTSEFNGNTPCRGGLGERSGPGVRPAHSLHGALPTQCIARIDQSVAYLEKYPYT